MTFETSSMSNKWRTVAREKQIKGILRSKKELLIKSQNPKLIDLYESILKKQRDSSPSKFGSE